MYLFIGWHLASRAGQMRKFSSHVKSYFSTAFRNSDTAAEFAAHENGNLPFFVGRKLHHQPQQ